MQQNTIIIGYSGHAYVAIDILSESGINVFGYCDNNEKEYNPYDLEYLGSEKKLEKDFLTVQNFFIGIGDNVIRNKIFTFLAENEVNIVNAIHPFSKISKSVKIGKAVMVAAGVIINPFCLIKDGVICNTNCNIDHECIIHEFVHLGPGAVVCGNVTIGENTFIGANSVIKQGITIGRNCMIGAGSVIIKNVPDNSTIVGNPGKLIKNK